MDNRLALNIRPNPTDGLVTISYTLPLNNKHFNLRIVNILGQIKYKLKGKAPMGKNEIVVNLKTSGVYIITLRQRKEMTSCKVIVVK